MVVNVCEHLMLVGVFAVMVSSLVFLRSELVVLMALKRHFPDEVAKEIMSCFNISQTSMETGTDVAK